MIILFGLAVLCIEIAYHSSLAYDFKQLLGLSDTNVPKLQLVAKYGFWLKFLPKYLKWLAVLPVLVLQLWIKIIELTSCPYCLAFWAGLTATYLRTTDILTSLGGAGLTIFFVLIIEIFLNLREKQW